MIELLAATDNSGFSPTIITLNTVVLLSRFLHLLSATLLVGGTLFYEMVVPIAIADLKSEQQLLIFARARWVFRRIVWLSTALIILTGAVSSLRNWPAYRHPQSMAQQYTQKAIDSYAHQTGQPSAAVSIKAEKIPLVRQPGLWWALHSALGVIAVGIAIFLTLGRSPPSHPVSWMRINLVILMVVIFLASATRHVRRITVEPRVTPADATSVLSASPAR